MTKNIGKEILKYLRYSNEFKSATAIFKNFGISYNPGTALECNKVMRKLLCSGKVVFERNCGYAYCNSTKATTRPWFSKAAKEVKRAIKKMPKY